MVYSLKDKINESKLTVESLKLNSIEGWIKDSVAAMTANEELTISRYFIDENFGFYAFWSDGFDPEDKSVIHATKQPTYALVCGLKCRNDAEWDGDYMDSPYDPKTGDLYTEDFEIPANGNYKNIAEWLIDDYNTMVDHINNGQTIGGLLEAKSIKEAPDADGILYDYEVGAKYNDMANAEMKQNAEYRKSIAEFKKVITNSVPEVVEILNTAANTPDYPKTIHIPVKSTFSIERLTGEIHLNTKYKLHGVPEGSNYITIEYRSGGHSDIEDYSVSVTDTGDIYTDKYTSSWASSSIKHDPGYAKVKALKLFTAHFDSFKKAFYSKINEANLTESAKSLYYAIDTQDSENSDNTRKYTKDDLYDFAKELINIEKSSADQKSIRARVAKSGKLTADLNSIKKVLKSFNYEVTECDSDEQITEAAFSGGVAGDTSFGGSKFKGRGASTQPSKNNYLNRIKSKNPELVDIITVKAKELKANMITQIGQIKTAEVQYSSHYSRDMVYVMHTNNWDCFHELDADIEVLADPDNKSKPYTGTWPDLKAKGLQETSKRKHLSLAKSINEEFDEFDLDDDSVEPNEHNFINKGTDGLYWIHPNTKEEFALLEGHSYQGHSTSDIIFVMRIKDDMYDTNWEPKWLFGASVISEEELDDYLQYILR